MSLKPLAAILVALALVACRSTAPQVPQPGEAFAEVSLLFNT